jgi:hypothetical protein
MIYLIALSLICSALAWTPVTFSGGKSSIILKKEETVVMEYFHNITIPDGTHSTVTHFWITGGNHTYIDHAIVRYYLDGETTPSIVFQPALACGVGFDEDQGPWSNDMMGHGVGKPDPGLYSDVTSWYSNIRIPFKNSIRATLALNPNYDGTGDHGAFMLVRGAIGVPIEIGGVKVPTGAKMVLQANYDVKLNPMDYFNLVDLPKGNGLILMTTLVVETGSDSFMEGCWRTYTPYGVPYEHSTLLSTGTEDYYDSAYYFYRAYPLYLPHAGLTHYSHGDKIRWSAFRMHTFDPLTFRDGVRLTWRNGDATPKPDGLLKCTIEKGGHIIGAPTVSMVTTYSWVCLERIKLCGLTF